ncbi:TonB-dependent receptor [Mangrovimonas spongiae]|uniref:TonB-dependent receptor n=1 Tax=Mangrovimonas spongiae TaxID=2494697 RepID=A0A428JX24_9FLAO|nr:TonB-dependent receptor [Mangrovimonas spongiae]RSK38737.1 TonB-dependent receptor [Mangrovimonas spongiae]
MFKRIFLFLGLITYSTLIFGQSNQKISISFNNTSLKQAIIKLEINTNSIFFYQHNWFEDKTITKDYKNANLSDILSEILSQTPLNFIILEDKVILTKNSIIHKSLPIGFFDTEDRHLVNKTTVFLNEYNKSPEINLTTIGKQNPNSSQDTYMVSGIVTDPNTEEPISNLVILINEGDKYTTTNDNGYYKIEVPSGLNTFKTNLLGYDSVSKNVVVYSDGNLNFNISESAEQLSEVLIEASRDKNIKSAVVGITTINVEEIKNIPLVLGERDILKVATTMPGVKTAGEGASGFNVRGGRTDQNLILLDDALIYNPSHFLGFFSALNPFTTGSFDIYKASIPAEFGGRLSSVFDIQSINGNTQKFSGEGSIGPVTANLALEVPIVKEKSSLVTGFRTTYSDWVLNLLEDESLKNSEASFLDAIIKYKHELNKNNSIQGTFYYSKDKFSISNDSTFKYNNQLMSLKWNHSFNEKNKLETILINSQFKYDIEYDANSSRNFDFGYKINETQLKLNFKYLHSKKHKFSYGINGKIYNINPGNIKPRGNESEIIARKINDEKALEAALYLSDEFEINDKLLIDVGLRYSFFGALGKSTENIYEENAIKSPSTVTDTKEFRNNEFSKTYGGPEARISFRYFLNPNLSLKGSYNKTIQYIHLLSNNTTESPTDTWKLSDYNIEPQKANIFSLGLYKNFQANNLEISLEGYYKSMNNILDYKVGADLNLNENIEQEVLQGEGKAYGIEFLIKKTKGKLNGWLGYSYSKSLIKLDSPFKEEIVNNGDFFPSNFDKPHDFTVVANYKLTHRYSISANFTYQTGRPITYPTGKYNFAGEQQVVYSDRNKLRIPDYYRLDLGINIEGNHKIKKLAHSFWNISVYNVLGRSNPYSVYFVNEGGSIKAYKTSVFAIPIPTITYNFKF